jgi:hypothetical protein
MVVRTGMRKVLFTTAKSKRLRWTGGTAHEGKNKFTQNFVGDISLKVATWKT